MNYYQIRLSYSSAPFAGHNKIIGEDMRKRKQPGLVPLLGIGFIVAILASALTANDGVNLAPHEAGILVNTDQIVND